MLDDKINKIHTPCKDCVFAVYEDRTQNECALKYLDIYKTNNIEILEAYDQDKEFYIINGKKCMGYRENKWFKQFDLDNSDLVDKIDKYHQTNHLDYFIVINLKLMSLDQLDEMLKQISCCIIQPKKVIFIRYSDNELKFPYSSVENLLKQYNVSYIWRIQTILDLSLEYEQILHNVISLNTKYRFTVSVSSYNEDIKHIVDTTNKIVHYDLDQFDIISNKDYSCIIFSGVIYRFEIFHGNDLLKNTEYYKIV